MRNHVTMAALGAAFLCVVGCGGGDDDGGPTPSSCLAPFTSFPGDHNLMGCAGLSVDSTPDGATVAVDGRVLPGTTPASWLVPEGPYTVEVTLDGYETFSQEVYATGFVTRVNATLVPTASAMGMLAVSIPPGIADATLLLDGTAVGTMPMAPIEVPEGSHRVTVMANGYIAAEPSVTIVRGETAMVTVAVGRDLTGSWMCTAGPREATMDADHARNIVVVVGIDAFVGIIVSGDQLSSMEGGTLTGTIATDGQSLEYTFTGPGGSYTERCTH